MSINYPPYAANSYIYSPTYTQLSLCLNSGDFLNIPRPNSGYASPEKLFGVGNAAALARDSNYDILLGIFTPKHAWYCKWPRARF